MRRAIYLIAAAFVGVPLHAQARELGETYSLDTPSDAEIVVTALKKEQRIQSTPVSLDVFSDLDLKSLGVVTSNELSKASPSLTVTNGGGSNTSLFMRGVGNTTNNNYLDPAITPTYDGVVQGRSTGAFSAALFDLERIEVLKGPQGTLYGRNATGGVVNVIPRKPQLNANGAAYEMSIGNYGAFSAQGHLNLALNASSALRFAASKQERNGFNRDGTDDLDRWAVRAQYLYQPSSTISVRLGADYTHVGGVGAGPTYLGHFSGSAFVFTPAQFDTYEGLNTSSANAYRQSSVRPSPSFYNLNPMSRSPEINFRYWGTNADVKIETSFGSLEIIPAYRESSGESYFYGPALNTAYQNEKNHQTSIEARLSRINNAFEYIIGGFYIREKIQSSSQFNQEVVLPIQNYETRGESAAAFANVSLRIFKNLKLNFGGRYTKDSKSMDGLINNFASFCGGIPPTSPPAAFSIGCNTPGRLPHWPNFTNADDTFRWLVGNNWISASSSLQPKSQVFPLLNGVGVIQKSHHPVNVSGSYNRLTWRLGAEYEWRNNYLLYASIEDGYRAGGFQLVEGDTSYDPEFIRSYSVGIKGKILNRKLSVSLDAFMWDYKDQQIGYFAVDFNSGILINKTANAGYAHIKGFEFDLSAKISNSTNFNVEVQYLDSRYKRLNFLTAPPRNNINCPSTPLIGANGQRVTVSGQGALNFDCSGKPLLFSPKWSANLGVEHTLSLGKLELVGSARTSWRSSQFGALEYLSFQKIQSYWVSDASLTAKGPDGRLAVTAFIHNIENKRRVARPLASPLGFASVIYTAPRLYGVRISSQF